MRWADIMGGNSDEAVMLNQFLRLQKLSRIMAKQDEMQAAENELLRLWQDLDK